MWMWSVYGGLHLVKGLLHSAHQNGKRMGRWGSGQQPGAGRAVTSFFRPLFELRVVEGEVDIWRHLYGSSLPLTHHKSTKQPTNQPTKQPTNQHNAHAQEASKQVCTPGPSRDDLPRRGDEAAATRQARAREGLTAPDPSYSPRPIVIVTAPSRPLVRSPPSRRHHQWSPSTRLPTTETRRR